MATAASDGNILFQFFSVLIILGLCNRSISLSIINVATTTGNPPPPKKKKKTPKVKKELCFQAIELIAISVGCVKKKEKEKKRKKIITPACNIETIFSKK